MQQTWHIEQGLIQGIRYYPSPNYNQRPVLDDISLVVLHHISLPPGEYGGHDIIDLFQNQLDCSKHPYYQQLLDTKVSAHLLIRRNGELVQFVPFHLRAWHAGKSSFQGLSNCNDYSIGIEMEGDDYHPFTACQYQMLANVLMLLMKQYPSISQNRIVGHCDVAPGRKTDPGPQFDWQGLKQILGEKLCI